MFVTADVRDAEQAPRSSAAVRALRAARRARQQRRGLAGRARRRRLAALLARYRRPQPAGPLVLRPGGQRRDAGQADGGSIVNIASVSGLRPSPGTAAYGAAKAGLINLTRTLAIEWAPKVRVNCVVAGMIATEAAEDHYGGPGGLAAVAATVPLGRMGTPGDVAGACLFLASPAGVVRVGAALEVARRRRAARPSWPPCAGPVRP